MPQFTHEILWINHLLKEVSVYVAVSAKLGYDNETALHIASNPVCHERTKHIEGEPFYP